MSVQISVVIQSNDDLTQLKFDTLSPQESMESLSNYLDKLSAGCGHASVDMRSGGGAASGTVTLASMVATDTVTVGNQVFTCVASGATANQFNVGVSDTATATNLAAAINASSSMAGVASATSAVAVVTVTSARYGAIGNLVALAISAHGSVSSATLSGGTNSTSHVMHAGL